MRCEVAASLIHKPKLLLLDEPSIGLDVVAKQHIRDAIRAMASVENVGVLLTSHDAGDLEALCKRVIIINHGKIVYQDKVSALKRSFLTSKLIEVRFAQQVSSSFQIQGTETIKVAKERYGVKLRLDTRQTPVERVLADLSAIGTLVDITISDPPLEEVIAAIYGLGEGPPSG
jgi:ABC-2 type transport system ATP-binding protein